MNALKSRDTTGRSTCKQRNIRRKQKTKIQRIWTGLWVGNDVGNVRLVEVLICLRKGMRRAINALTAIKGGLRTAKQRRRSVTNERTRRKNTERNYAMREVHCLTCGCKVRKCKWGRHILSKKHVMSAGDKGSEDGKGGVVS